MDRTSYGQMSSKLLIGSKILYSISSYISQSGLSESKKDNFFFNLLVSILVVLSGNGTCLL